MPSANAPKSAAMVVVSLSWNGEPLAMRKVGSDETVVLGDAKGSLSPLPKEVLGRASLEIAKTAGGPFLLVPEGKVASIVDRKGQLRLIAGPAEERLSPGEEASLLFGDFEVKLASFTTEPAATKRRAGAGAWVHTAVVAAIHGALLFAGSRAALASAVEAPEPSDLTQLQAYLASVEERSASADAVKSDGGGQRETQQTNGRNGNGEDGGGQRRSGKEGKAGSPDSRAKNRHFGAPKEQEKERGTKMTAETEVFDARSFGMAGILNTMKATPQWETEGQSAWSAADPLTATGGLLGRITGESEGAGGLSLSGTGEGGGGRGDGIGLGTIGTIGHADGLAGIGTSGDGSRLSGIGFGSGRGHWGRIPRVRRPIRWHEWGVAITGRLPPEIVQRIVRSNFGRFRYCYEKGLVHAPELSGRVTARFVIGRDGAVANVANGGSDMPDGVVTNCVLKAFYSLSFPQPDGGIVEVTYPIMFTPG